MQSVSGVTASFYKMGDSTPCLVAPLKWVGLSKGGDIFMLSWRHSHLPVGLYACLITCQTPEGERYVVCDTDENGALTENCPTGHTKQILIYKRKYPQCTWLEGGIMYQIFVDRFARGEETPLSDGSIFNPDWDNGIPQFPAYPGAPLKNNMFFGGNFSGIIDKLPYLASLHVNCLYLSPICKATSNHKYDTGDYMEVDPSFGGEERLKQLIEKAKEYGIHIILDGVFNHTGDDSIYFNRYGKYPSVGAYQSKSSPYANWFTFEKFPDTYACWWGIAILPKLNLQNEEVRAFITGAGGVIEHYAQMGIDGFRLDVADELDDDFIASIKSKLASVSSQNVLYGEVWEDASCKIAYDTLKQYYWGKQLDGVMNYPLCQGILRYIKYGETGPLRYAIETVMRNAPKDIMHLQMNFLGTHDTERIISALSDISFEGKSNAEIAHLKLSHHEREVAKTRLKLAYLALITMPGVPMIYYGDEIGMEGYKDPFNRMPYPWKHQDIELLSYMQQILALRKHNSVYANGNIKVLHMDENAMLYLRENNQSRHLIVINRGEIPMQLHINGKHQVLFGATSHNNLVSVAPNTGSIISLSKKANGRLTIGE